MRTDEPPRNGVTPDDEERLAAEALEDEEEDARIAGLGAILSDRRKLATFVGIIALAVVAIYVLIPKIVGFDDVAEKIHEADWYWVVIAVGFNILAFGAYVMLFRGILGGRDIGDVRRRLDYRASYQITMAGLAATRIFSAAGAGGIILSYWALRKAGLERRRAACRMVAFLVLMYSVYLLALVLFGVLLRTGVLPGEAPTGGTTVPAALAGGALVILLLVSLIPGNFERRLSRYTGEGRMSKLAQRLATVPATLAMGVRTALAYVRHPRDGSLAIAGAVGFWAANIGILWASFKAFGTDVPFGVLVQGFFVGMTANLIPSPAGGVGSVDAGMIGAFVLFGVDSDVVLPAVLTYRVIAFWLPIPPGIVAYFQLRRTVARWEAERGVYTSESKVTVEAPSA